MSRQELKFDAKEKMRQASVNPYLVTVIMGVVLVLLAVVQSFFDLWGGIVGSYDGESLGSYIGFSIVFFIVYFVLSTILEFGYHTYCLKVANRDSSMSYGDLFSSARYLLKALGLMIVMTVFVSLWMVLLVIPGVIAAYRYSQAIFIMAENPEKGILQCIRESKEMMIGHKMEYFVLELSFIPWALLGSFTCGLGFLYVYPYMTVTFANYYNSLKPAAAAYAEGMKE